MEYRVEIKQIANGWLVDFYADPNPVTLGESQQPIHVENYDEAVKLAVEYLTKQGKW